MNFKTLIIGAAMLVASAQAASAGTVTGLVTDRSGAPLAGVNVEVVFQTYNADDLPYGGESIKQTAITDESGRYEISTESLPPGIYMAHAYQVVVDGGRSINLDFRAQDDSTFGSHEDVVRDFTGGYYESAPDDPYGNGGIFVLERSIETDIDLLGAEVTLTNTATGQTIVRTVRPTGEGLVVTGVPFGTYRAEVTLNGQSLQISLMGPGISEDYAASATHDFTMGWLGNQFRVMAKP
ncbi:MAG: carboxypeptidase-like regulatory domain-containing protein [Rhizobium sp.]|nr:carboxypeptidase-like regulatory domain-containing protein [Rhizobium sp.]